MAVALKTSRTMVSRFLSTYPGFRYGEGGVEKYGTRPYFPETPLIVNGLPLGYLWFPFFTLRFVCMCVQLLWFNMNHFLVGCSLLAMRTIDAALDIWLKVPRVKSRGARAYLFLTWLLAVG